MCARPRLQDTAALHEAQNAAARRYLVVPEPCEQSPLGLRRLRPRLKVHAPDEALRLGQVAVQLRQLGLARLWHQAWRAKGRGAGLSALAIRGSQRAPPHPTARKVDALSIGSL